MKTLIFFALIFVCVAFFYVSDQMTQKSKDKNKH